MTAQDPFMTLVDAATAIIDDKKKAAKQAADLSIMAPPRKISTAGSVTHGHAGYSTTPPPHTSHGKAAIVSPSTPKASNKTQTIAEAIAARAPNKKSFARLLMDTLLDPSLNDIITFLPDGDAFAILEPKKFQDEVMEERFGIRTFSPFVRKLHRWGFERIMDKKTHAVDVFRHPLFIRGNYHLCDKIKCIGRLVKGPLEEAILTQAGINNKTIGMPTHQELEIRHFCERMSSLEQQPPPPTTRDTQRTKNSDDLIAQAYLLEQAARKQEARRRQQEAQEAILQKANLRLQAEREAEHARQLLAQQQQQAVAAAAAVEPTPTVQQILLALESRNREEELIAQELQRIKQEELLRQQIAREANLSNSLQQARLQELLGVGNVSARQSTASNDVSASALLRAALENNSGGALAAQLRQYM